jgi:phosphonate degradation associated HDIG domain protein
MGLSIADIRRLFAAHGHVEYAGEGVSQLEHALQAGRLAEEAGAPVELVTAAFLHDLGHLLNLQGETPTARGIDDRHQYFAIPFLRPLFPPAVIEPIRLHVDAKRALCALEPGYHEALSEDSKRSLVLQGGIYSPVEAGDFAARPHARDAMRLRRWDDAAKLPGAETPDLDHFLELAARCAV